MLKFSIVYLLCFAIDTTMQQSCDADDQYPWSYHGPDNGPSHWGGLYPDDCEKQRQSPIAINDADVTEKDYSQMTFIGYDKPVTKAKVQNLGWTVMVTPKDGVVRTIAWGNPDKAKVNAFDLINIRFHFGSEGGAEHVINNITYPMEIQYHTYEYNRKVTAIFSTLMDVDDDDNSAFDAIVEVLSDVKYRKDSTEIKSDLDLSKLLPNMTYYYYNYLGSDTIPPCEAYYLWFIVKDIGKIGKDQLDTFMTLYSVVKDDASSYNCKMGPNARPVQALGNRVVYIAPESSKEN